jgi:copper chaperone
MSSVLLQVEGMSCGGCVASVKRALSAVEHVMQVEVELESGRVTVLSDTDLSPEVLARAVRAAGFDVPNA